MSRNSQRISNELAYLGRGWSFPPRWSGLRSNSGARVQGWREPKDERDRWLALTSNFSDTSKLAAGAQSENPESLPHVDFYKVEMSEALEDIRQAICIVLGTRRGERVMRPEFGSNLHAYVFESISPQTLNLIETEVVETLTVWERRIREIEVDATPSSSQIGRIDVEISFVIDTHRMRQSLIYPFYVRHPESK